MVAGESLGGNECSLWTCTIIMTLWGPRPIAVLASGNASDEFIDDSLSYMVLMFVFSRSIFMLYTGKFHDLRLSSNQYQFANLQAQREGTVLKCCHGLRIAAILFKFMNIRYNEQVTPQRLLPINLLCLPTETALLNLYAESTKPYTRSRQNSSSSTSPAKAMHPVIPRLGTPEASSQACTRSPSVRIVARDRLAGRR